MAKAASRAGRLLRVPAEVVVGLYVGLDAIVAPIFGPVMRFLSGLAVIRRIERRLATLPPYVLLGLLVVPFAVAELAKVYAVYLIGTGHFKTGVSIFVGAYVVSILVCERIFAAGKGQLLTIGWFARLFHWLMGYKERLFAWFRTTEIWRLANGLKESVRAGLRALKTRLLAVFGGRTDGSFG